MTASQGPRRRSPRGLAALLVLGATATVVLATALVLMRQGVGQRSATQPSPTAAQVAAAASLPAESTSSPVAAVPQPSNAATWPIRIGAVFPMTGDAAPLAAAELRGVQIAADAVNAGGGVDGRQIVLDVREVDSAGQASGVLASLQAAGASTVIGTYSSALSIPVSAAAASLGMVYWESGAVADRLTGRGLPLVFRVGASGSNLGTNSAAFAATDLAPRLGKPVQDLRVAIVNADDDYASSVAAAADRTAIAAGMQVVAREQYQSAVPRFGALMRRLAKARPDILILASHIPDGIAFRRAMLKANLHVGALIGTTMAECVPDFADPLGKDAVGIFGSDRPAGGFDPEPLSPEAYAIYEKFEDAWKEEPPTSGAWPDPSAPSASPAPSGTDTWDWSGNSAFEEALAGFTAGWALFDDVLPRAATGGGTDAGSIAAAARTLDLPDGSLPNGAGLHFSTDPGTLGQNERAIGMIWQWQAPGKDVVVWPGTFATGKIAFVPLPK